MEKTIFLFRRHPHRSPEDFAHYYVNNHAPLGARTTRCLQGYTVNIVEGERGPDAITEHWLQAATDILTPGIAYATPEDFQAVLADDRTLFDGAFRLYVGVEEIQIVPGRPLDSPLRARTPETKLIWLYPDASTVPPPPAAARRVVDDRIGYRLSADEKGFVRHAPDIAVVRSAWGPSVEAFGDDASDAIVVQEYRFIAAPEWAPSGA